MTKSFYQFMTQFRYKMTPDEVSDFANAIFSDLQFPKHSDDYNEISSYLENNAYYISNMTLFDVLWDQYLDNNK